jgi:hypothetical protein
MSELEPTPQECAAIGQRALVAVGFNHQGEDLESGIVDLVANLLHLARENDIEPDYVIAQAQMHYDAEVEEGAKENKA